jgi:hypothetical protein
MTEHLPECPKSGCEACYKQGQRDALDAAVQRVEALFLENLSSNGFVNAIIAAIKGDQP